MVSCVQKLYVHQAAVCSEPGSYISDTCKVLVPYEALQLSCAPDVTTNNVAEIEMFPIMLTSHIPKHCYIAWLYLV